MNAPTTRQIPHDVGAERAVIGAVLLNPDSLGRAQEAGLVEDSFYRQPHRTIWSIFAELDNRNTPIDLATVSGRLEERGLLEPIGGYSYLAGLPPSTPSVANLHAYVRTVLDKAQLRALMTSMAETHEAIYVGEKHAEEIIADAEQSVFRVGDAVVGKSLEHIGPYAEEFYDDLRARAENPVDVHGLATGFRDLDRKLGGLVGKRLIVLAGRPAMGKTAFALNAVLRAALDQQAHCAIFSLEMGTGELTGRLIASESRVLANRIKSGRLHADDWPLVIDATERIHTAPIFIDDTPSLTMPQLFRKCRRLKRKKGRLDLVVVDYLQLMSGTGKEGNREQEISGISRGLKGLAKEFDIPVIALSQLNRGVEQRADKRPLMSDLRESGAIEQDADQIFFLYRDEVYNPNTEMKGIAEVLIRKNRHGDIGDVKLFWRGEYVRFENLARDEYA